MTGSELYQRQIRGRDDELMHQVWSGTPWMTDAFTGPGHPDGRYREILLWCRDEFGPEALPIHGRSGKWRVGGATVFGWTWMGFETEEMMRQFQERWPVPEGVTR